MQPEHDRGVGRAERQRAADGVEGGGVGQGQLAAEQVLDQGEHGADDRVAHVVGHRHDGGLELRGRGGERRGRRGQPAVPARLRLGQPRGGRALGLGDDRRGGQHALGVPGGVALGVRLLAQPGQLRGVDVAEPEAGRRTARGAPAAAGAAPT